jgi:RNA polymerase sigma factor (sigma-70 family)
VVAPALVAGDPVESVPDGPGWVSDPADEVAARDQGRWLLESLAPRARTVLVLRYYADLDDAAIADVMGISVSAVRATASRALASLRERPPGEAGLSDVAANAAEMHARTEELR